MRVPSVNQAMYVWWIAWQNAIRNAYRYPPMREDYCNQAALCQCQYLCYKAQENGYQKS
jgi:hypothetical protein